MNQLDATARPRRFRGLIPLVALAAVLCPAWVSGAEFCLAPDGDDANPGTRERPFASIQRAQKSAGPGDDVIIRGGAYRMKESDIARRDGFLASVIDLDKSGTRERPIRYFAATGERPVFDCSEVKPPGLRISAFRVRASWLHLKGIEVTGVQVTATGHTQSICFENLGDHNVFEQLSMHDGEAIGLFITRGSGNLVLNCDAFRNHDSTSQDGRGGNTDGFGCHSPRSGEPNVFRGCRAWFNSDDGFDCISAAGSVVFENCWAFHNGYTTAFKRLGDGNGFKAGGYGIDPGRRFPDPIPRHRVENCLAVRNPSAGFYANHHPGGIDWIGNAAYRNGVNFNFLGRSADGRSDIPGRGHKVMNNLSHGSSRDLRNLDLESCEHAGNWFDPPRKFSDDDFINLDESTLTAARQPDGSLPDVRFMQLKR